MNQCCWRWRFGATSHKKDGALSTRYERDQIRFCPSCGSELDEDKTDAMEQIAELKAIIEKASGELHALEAKIQNG